MGVDKVQRILHPKQTIWTIHPLYLIYSEGKSSWTEKKNVKLDRSNKQNFSDFQTFCLFWRWCWWEHESCYPNFPEWQFCKQATPDLSPYGAWQCQKLFCSKQIYQALQKLAFCRPFLLDVSCIPLLELRIYSYPQLMGIKVPNTLARCWIKQDYALNLMKRDHRSRSLDLISKCQKRSTNVYMKR